MHRGSRLHIVSTRHLQHLWLQLTAAPRHLMCSFKFKNTTLRTFESSLKTSLLDRFRGPYFAQRASYTRVNPTDQQDEWDKTQRPLITQQNDVNIE
ncbi:hypothetical protein AVEN_178595-1 [Araneus ventricosus]|uniref:Uncharacterized protein n=1 Tax=Araneus ventricosus TaxID=182803 RepID=A0A4Y2WNZ0_ARAVE|nr:hypothetical protein AVEN_178595-1 [Araneus ventricosus]